MQRPTLASAIADVQYMEKDDRRPDGYDASGSLAEWRLEAAFGVLKKIVDRRRHRAAWCDEPQHGERRLSADRDVAHARRTQLADGFRHQRHTHTRRDETDHRGHLRGF